ncbi:MAG: amino acid ABC transporter substrate-binding protein [Clostridiales bacterium]|nr:amino acid ABC transporter substrate-binding protein [Clostridiales bacterium]
MKKWMSLLLALVTMVTVLAGCNANSKPSSGEDKSWQEVEKAGELVLGMDTAFPPMGYKDEQTGELVGFDLDVATEVCARLGVTLKKQPINWKTQVNEINNDNVDCLWNGLSKTEGREKTLNLSIPYMKNNQIILVKVDSEYKNLTDLAGKNLGVQAGSSAADALDASTEFKNSLGDIISIDDYSKAIIEMKNGTIDAIAIDEVVARYYLTKEPDTYRILMKDDKNVESLAVEDYVIGFKIGDDALKAKIEDTLKAMDKDGKLAEISKKWFGEDVTTIGK